MELKLLTEILDQSSSMNISNIVFEGGEPFLYPYLTEAIDLSLQFGITPILITNGTISDDSILKNLAKNKLPFVQVSLDGSSEERLKNIRGRGTFGKVIQTISKFRQYGINVRINFVVLRTNINDISEMIRLAVELNVKELRLLRCVDFGANSVNLVNRSEIICLHSWLMSEKKRLAGILEITPVVMTANDRQSYYNPPFFIEEGHENYNVTCWAARFTSIVDFNGDVYPCHYLMTNDNKAGNLYEEDLCTILEKSPVFKKIRQGIRPNECRLCGGWE